MDFGQRRWPSGVTVVMVGELPGRYFAGTLQSQRARIWLCGPLRVELDGRRVETLLPARQGRLLFTYLVLRRRPVGRDELVEVLWPQRSPVDAQGALNTLVARLRAALGAGTVAGRSELSLVLGSDPWIDVEVAQAAVTAARAELQAGSASEAWSCAEEALGIVKQPLLRDLVRPWLDDDRLCWPWSGRLLWRSAVRRLLAGRRRRGSWRHLSPSANPPARC
jgi:hypothetical protein